MKKSKIIKLFIAFICMFSIFLIGNNVYGYKLTFKGVASENGLNVRTWGYTFGSKTVNDVEKGWQDCDDNRKGTEYGTGSGYETYALVFFKDQWSSNYNSSSGTYYIGYDEVDSEKKNNTIISKEDLEVGNMVNYLKIGKTNIVDNNTDIYNNGFNEDNILFYSRGNKDNGHFYEKRLCYLPVDENFGSTNQQTITVSDWFISKNTINEVINKFGLNSTNNRINFSLPGRSMSKNWNTAYEAVFDMKEQRGFASPNYDADSATPGSSAINLYDNTIIIPSEAMQPQEVYIRHVDEKGNLLNIANSSEVLINSSGESIKNNGQDNNPHTEYQEYYKINLGERLRVSRSLKMAVNGKLYKYENAIVSSGKTFDETKGNDNININNNTRTLTSFTVGGEDTNKAVTIVTFIYSEDVVPGYPTTPENPPTGDIHTDFSSDTNTSECIQKYTPTDEKVTPYLKANKTLLKDLVYILKKNGDEVNYYIDSFNIQKLDGGKVSDDLEDYPETGKIFGDEPYTLFNLSDKYRELRIKEFNLKEANDFKNKYENDLPSQNAIDNFVNNQSKSGYEDFNLEENRYFIPEEKYNGLRNPKLSAHYKAVNILNNDDEISGGLGYIDTNNEVNVIVYNPLELDKVNVTSKEIIDHTTSSSSSSSSNTNVIQKNADFTVSFKTKESSHYASITDTLKYLDYYYLFFDIDVVLKSDYQIRERTNTEFSALKTASAGSTVIAGTLIKINKDDKEFNAIASSNKQGEDIVSQIENNVVLIGVTNNMPSVALENLIFTNAVEKYVIKNESKEEKYINTTTSTNRIDFKDYCDENPKAETNHEVDYTSGKQMYSDAYYFAMARAQTTNVGRIYDFKVTDCSDIDYKSVFRKSSNTGSVNDLTGVQYFSGVKLFNIYTNEINTLEKRENLNISNNSSAKKIIPLGPYKNTNTSYISAPKMGYRISFDLKTSGYYDKKGTSTREIAIKPSYYYISKDGKKFVNNVNLYYKNSSGKYINFVGSDYTIYFKPKDGYRSVANSYTAGNTSQMSDQLEPLVVGSNSGFTLNSKMMSTADNNFIQAWYGEFKLPNSTIAVEESNISKPLTDGYIGVKFEIKSIDRDGNGNIIREISYNQDNQNAKNKTNTTQWDYEGFLGFTNYGNEVDKIPLQLEKGIWEINNSTYQSIKGSVALFDTDNRAANDFD